MIYHEKLGYAEDLDGFRVEYGREYFDKYVGYRGTPIAVALNRFRVGLVEKYCSHVLDVGIGSGEFLESLSIAGDGFDVNPVAVEWLRDRGRFADPYVEPWRWDGVCLWDVIEHLEDPAELLGKVLGGYLFATIPVFASLESIETSKHRKRGEHLRYWTRDGFVGFMGRHGFRLLADSDQEVRAGREDVHSFVFKRD